MPRTCQAPRLLARQIGERLQACRQDYGWTQRQLAGRLHLTQSHLAQLEGGHRLPNLWTLSVLARALGTTLDYLVTGATDVPEALVATDGEIDRGRAAA
jgi:transcriptional regulator with XRE-family HTH domain